MAHLHYRKDNELTWKRVKKGSGFSFVNESGKAIPKVHKLRMLSLKIPPAWENVTLSPDPLSHIQAMGVDAKGRSQYIYHPEWVKKSQEHKFDRMVTFGERLPTLRRQVHSHMKDKLLTRERVVATVIWLLENTFIRVGNRTYAVENESYGLTTMRDKHLKIRGSTVSFSFKGKSGVEHDLDVTNPLIAKNIKACIELPGYEIFQYIDEDEKKQVVDSADVNEYLQKYAGSDFSAKDFRTWGGSVLAGESFYEKGEVDEEAELKKAIADVVNTVSKHLGNTKAVCRTYYIHPVIIESYEKGILVPHFEHSYKRVKNKKLKLTKEEYATWSLIKNS